MRALVFGGTGMLGQAVARQWRSQGSAVLALSRDQADLTDRASLLAWVHAFHPQLIINCAAFTKVDDCESRRDHALEVNGRAVANAVAAAEKAGTPLIHISSDYVFDGQRPGGEDVPYPEDHPIAPISAYGESKSLGESEALRYHRSLVVRASWLFGPGGPNFAKTISRLLRSGTNPLRVVDDQVGLPTYTPFLARALWDLSSVGARGIVHYGNREAVSWHGFASEIAAAIRPEAEVLPVTTKEFPRPAPRPAWSVLDVRRFQGLVGRRVEPWNQGLAAYLEIPGELT